MDIPKFTMEELIPIADWQDEEVPEEIQNYIEENIDECLAVGKVNDRWFLAEFVDGMGDLFMGYWDDIKSKSQNIN